MDDSECSCCGGHETQDKSSDIKNAVRERYAKAITKNDSCGSCCSPDAGESLAEMAGYCGSELENLPGELAGTSYGCGNPVALAMLSEGETVLDIGSGAGLDVILAARKVAPGGNVIGLDMTREMIDRANKNVKAAGIDNVEFRLGDAENMPVEDESVDVIMSNCVINLVPDKQKVFAECYRVLKPGGRIMISDIVAEEMPPEIRRNKAAWCACIAGAWKESDYIGAIRNAGLEDIRIVSRTDYDGKALETILSSCCSGEETRLANELSAQMAGKVSSITVHAAKARAGG